MRIAIKFQRENKAGGCDKNTRETSFFPIHAMHPPNARLFSASPRGWRIPMSWIELKALPPIPRPFDRFVRFISTGKMLLFPGDEGKVRGREHLARPWSGGETSPPDRAIMMEMMGGQDPSVQHPSSGWDMTWVVGCLALPGAHGGLRKRQRQGAQNQTQETKHQTQQHKFGPIFYICTATPYIQWSLLCFPMRTTRAGYSVPACLSAESRLQ